MKTLDLRVRYFQDSTPADVPCRETAFIRRELKMPLPVDETALVLVDLWNVHFIESWIERAAQVTTECVVPVINAARKAGLTIVHAPSPSVAAQYPQLDRHKPPEPSTPSAWPPSDFRSPRRRLCSLSGTSQPTAGYRHPLGTNLLHNSPSLPQLMSKMTNLSSRRGSSYMNSWRERRILHLLFAGFATNWCVLGRDYGIRSMSRYGYNIILFRDATTGVEFPDTYDNLFTTEISIPRGGTAIRIQRIKCRFLCGC